MQEMEIDLRRIDNSLGLGLDGDNVVEQVYPFQAAAIDGRIEVGDKIVAVNGILLGAEQRLASLLPSSDAPVLLRLQRRGPTLDPATVEDLKRVFARLANGSSSIRVRDLHQVMLQFHAAATLPQTEKLMAEVDLNSDGEVTEVEFLLLMEKKMQVTTTAAQLFEALDTSGRGQLTPSALRDALLKYELPADADTIDEMIRAVDANRNGSIGLDEFQAALVPQRKRYEG